MVEITKSIIKKYGGLDADVRTFLEAFDEPLGSKILEVGAQEEYASNILSDMGHIVTGIDLRPYRHPHPCNYEHIVGDFCMLPDEFLREHIGTFDAAFSTSAIEHFGLGTYGEGHPRCGYDTIAMHIIWQLLRMGGMAYITVPYGGKYIQAGIHWRSYDKESLNDLIIQSFEVIEKKFFMSGELKVGKKIYHVGDELTPKEADAMPGEPPHSTVFLKLCKVEAACRAAPNR